MQYYGKVYNKGKNWARIRTLPLLPSLFHFWAITLRPVYNSVRTNKNKLDKRKENKDGIYERG